MTAVRSFPFSPQLLADAVPQRRKEPARNATARILEMIMPRRTAIIRLTVYHRLQKYNGSAVNPCPNKQRKFKIGNPRLTDSEAFAIIPLRCQSHHCNCPICETIHAKRYYIITGLPGNFFQRYARKNPQVSFVLGAYMVELQAITKGGTAKHLIQFIRNITGQKEEAP